MARSKTPLILGFCPDSPAALAEPDTRDLFARIREQIAAALQGIPGLCLIGPDDLKPYPVEVYYDPQRDQLGHIPYTPLFYAALGTILARRVHALKSPAYKVIVLDCDNTLWKGVVGEEGIAGITIPPAWSRLQQFMVEQASKGVLLCLCSKNDESDVLDVFEQRPDMVLKRDHLVAWRINWEPKSENIRALAQELNLGLDSFIFLDDNPVECAEVQAGCPEVLTLRLPIDGDIAGFIEHVWAFDRLSVTSEDQQRTAMYQAGNRTRPIPEAGHDHRGVPRGPRPSDPDFGAGADADLARGPAHATDQSVQLHHRPPQRRRDPAAFGIGPGMPGGGGAATGSATTGSSA